VGGIVAAPEFHTLLALQDHDTAIDRLVHRRETLPERAARHDLLVKGQSLAAQRDEVAGQRDVVVERQTQLEAELASSEARIVQLDKRMYSGEVSASRDLQAMAEEIDRLKVHCSKLEDRILATLEEREPLDSSVAEMEASLRSIADEIAGLDRAISEQEAEIDGELATERSARDGLAAGVPDALHTRYEQLRKKLGGIGAAPLNGHSCGGCHLTLPATEIDRIKREPPDALILCDQCGRILVRQS
jgi:predicted  nucleic acid-binding Zn-ribbon protein